MDSGTVDRGAHGPAARTKRSWLLLPCAFWGGGGGLPSI